MEEEIYSREFGRYLESIYFKYEEATISRKDVRDPFIKCYRNQYGNFSRAMFGWIVVDENEKLIDIGNVGLDVTKEEIENHFAKYKSILRDDKLDKILK